MNKAVNEMERKFLVKPDCVANMRANSESHKYIKQTYLSFDPELRIKRIISVVDNIHTIKNFYLASKSKKDIGRNEKEFEIKYSTYMDLYKNRESGDLYKNRYIIPLSNGLEGELDIYKDFDFSVIEVEFKDKESMDNFVPPDWFGKEITHEIEYSNKTMAKSLKINK